MRAVLAGVAEGKMGEDGEREREGEHEAGGFTGFQALLIFEPVAD